jgi:hypothetical protein
MQPNTSNKPTQNRAALKSFEAGSLDVCPSSSSSFNGEAVLTAMVTLVPDSSYFGQVAPWIHERHEIPEGAIPELPTDDLAAVVRTVMERGFRHLVIESRGAQRVETLIANSLAKYLQISSGQLSVTRLMFRRNEVAFTTWKEQVIGEPLRSS